MTIADDTPRVTGATPWVLRAPCHFCGGPDGTIDDRNGQRVVTCTCGAYQYCAPRTETGERQRSVTTVHRGIRPSVRAAVLQRATGRCELCGAGGALHVGHLLSVADGLAAGLTDPEINHPDNLAAMCEECNLGLGDTTVSLRLAVAIAVRRIKAQHTT